MDMQSGILRLPPKTYNAAMYPSGIGFPKSRAHKESWSCYIGPLQHACHVIQPGWSFFRQMTVDHKEATLQRQTQQQF